MKTGAAKLGTAALAAVLLMLLGGCMTPAYQWHTTAPAPCADSTYVALKQQHPDSLSERAWQRLQAIDRQCATARTYERERNTGDSAHGGWFGGHRDAGIAAGVMVVFMTVMLIRMW